MSYGEVFTRPWVVSTLLDLTGYVEESDLGALRLVEPSVGAGAFLGPALARLVASAKRHERPLDSLSDSLRCYDLQVPNVDRCRAMAGDLLVDNGCDPTTARLLAKRWVRHADFLLDDEDVEADVVVGNPPYIRIENLDPTVSDQYRARWRTMGGRADIYVGFLERSLSILRPGGRLGFICADRWMRNQYGRRLREVVATGFAVDHVWTMHDVDAFEEQVSAYPAITVIRRAPQGPAAVVAANEGFGANSAPQLARWSTEGSSQAQTGVGYSAFRLPHWFRGDEPWPSGDPRRLALVEELNDRLPLLEDPATSTKVGIGVATGADKTYVLTDPTVVEPDRALPLSLGRDLVHGTFDWSGHHLANPWNRDGSLVDLDTYPLLRAHLERSATQLRQRHIARKNPQSWHRTIDKVNHSLTPQRKLLFRDLAVTANPVLEPGGFYPHHNLYWVTSEGWDLEVLGGLLLSRIAQAFVEAYGVRMRGGTLRFQAQNLKRIRVPAPDSIETSTAEALRGAFRTRDATAATVAAAEAYGVDLQAIGGS